jgi:hypothetical protein
MVQGVGLLYTEENISAYKSLIPAKHQWFTPVILASWEAEIRRISLGKQFSRPYLKNNQHEPGLVEWPKG